MKFYLIIVSKVRSSNLSADIVSKLKHGKKENHVQCNVPYVLPIHAQLCVGCLGQVLGFFLSWRLSIMQQYKR
jgi:hypothetical protein